MPDGAPADIVVGRTLSSATVSRIQDHELVINCTVYNEQASDVTGVLLATTLQPGVTFQSTSVPPDRNGPELSWSLGTIPAFGRTSVELTVALADPIPLQIDGGARAFGTLDARTVGDEAPAATLRPEAIPAELLASTLDADATDPFVQQKAAKLDYAPRRSSTS